MKTFNKKRSVALSLLFWVVITISMAISMILVGVVIYLLFRAGYLIAGEMLPRQFRFVVYILISCMIIGSIIVISASRVLLKPVNAMINAMNRLSSGDYKTRLHFGQMDNIYPTSREISESFNHLAEELDHTEMLRSDFVNNFSHEFKTPIVSIAGFAKLLKRGNLTEEQQKEYLSIIESEAMRLSDMAVNVLSLTKIENQSILTDTENYNLSEQIRSCVLMLENKWSARQLNLEMDFDEYEIHANPEMLKQVWLNLIDNAIKFCYESGTIEIRITETEERLLVAISDTGIQIPQEACERIFRKFYQADESHSTEGNGIGLAVAHKIIDLHHGDITVCSSPQKTIFTVTLPKQ